MIRFAGIGVMRIVPESGSLPRSLSSFPAPPEPRKEIDSGVKKASVGPFRLTHFCKVVIFKLFVLNHVLRKEPNERDKKFVRGFGSQIERD